MVCTASPCALQPSLGVALGSPVSHWAQLWGAPHGPGWQLWVGGQEQDGRSGTGWSRPVSAAPRAGTQGSTPKQGEHVMLPLQGAPLASSPLWLWVFQPHTGAFGNPTAGFSPFFPCCFPHSDVFLNPHKVWSICSKELCRGAGWWQNPTPRL